ncbi:MAG: glycoside hydrolase family 127 protein [Prevotella sp.]|nr:glycoside hydrolase family 127 protein [Prevotella sp.]
MKKKSYWLMIGLMALLPMTAMAQQNGLTDTRNSKYAVMTDTPIDAVRWTGGFWGERFNVFAGTSVKNMWKTWQTEEGKGFNNFLVASGEIRGKHHGPPFHDGDMYKWLESVAAVYAINKDPELDAIMDRFIGCVVKSQREDGYIHTPVIIEELNKRLAAKEEGSDNTVVGTAVGTGKDGAFGNRLNFETYNLGHLITAGIVHKRATGKTTLFNCAIKAADFLYNFCMTAPEELAGNAICPSHYMAIAEIYRETGDPKYLELSKKFIDIRGMVKEGTDDNQDRIPFRDQYNAMGHAVRANYLYAGVADLYLESGEEQLMKNLTSIWKDIVTRKMYINGACGALYDGTSPDGTDYKPANIQKVHQSYGRPYQLPQSTAHNETCANIGNMLFNWRMLEATGDSKYADIVENCFFNSILCGISLDGKRYFYTNPLRMSDELPYTLRWPKERAEYISCFCCPPNTLRTLCETQDYAYSMGRQEVYVNLYGENQMKVMLDKKNQLVVAQHTDYPWDGRVILEIQQVKKNTPMTFKLRIPSWCDAYSVTVNDQKYDVKVDKGYAVVTGNWKKGDFIALDMPMRAKLIEANPLVEEARGQVAVQRGPIIYCVESQDLGGMDIDNIALPVDASFTPVETNIAGSRMMALEGEAVNRGESTWSGQLYREVGRQKNKVKIRLIPYYAWGNRGKGEMSIWIPVVL